MVTALPSQPPVLPVLQGVAGALPAGLAARPTSAALTGGAPPEDEGLVPKRPPGLPPRPSPNTTVGQGKAECWEGGGLGYPDPSSPSSPLELPAARCPNGGASRLLPFPQAAVMRGDHNFSLPGSRVSTGMPSAGAMDEQGVQAATPKWGRGTIATPSLLRKDWGTTTPPPRGRSYLLPTQDG